MKLLSKFLVSGAMGLGVVASYADSGWGLKNGRLLFEGDEVLSQVPGNVRILPKAEGFKGVALDFHSKQAFSEKEFVVGVLNEAIEFTSAYRAISSCWMEPRIGSKVSEIPRETQFLIMSAEGEETFSIFIPLIDETHRSSLVGRKGNSLNLIAESGDPLTKTKSTIGLYIARGHDPYELMETAASEIRSILGGEMTRTARLLPEIGNYFGWCTWNAFYSEVSSEKVMSGLGVFREGGASPRWLLVDDGWQQSKDDLVVGLGSDRSKFPDGLSGFVKKVKGEYGVRKILNWQTLWGYWRGCSVEADLPFGVEAIDTYIAPRLTPSGGQEGEMDPEDAILSRFYPYPFFDRGVQLPDIPAFYAEYHRYLNENGIDGVKLDALTWVEVTGSGRGGRIKVMKEMIDALGVSSEQYFDNNIIYCSGCSNDIIFTAPRNAVMRSSKDFRPLQPETNSAHILINAYNSYFMGEFVIPDWDMFQSGHEAGAYHAAARAISGGPIYCADEIGGQNFTVLRKLMLSDGRLPQPLAHGRPTVDSFFVDPKVTNQPIKIFNLNTVGGVVGAFNCSYSENETPNSVGTISPSDIPGLESGVYAVYSHKAEELVSVTKDTRFPINLGEHEFEIFTVAPIISGFAPIGLADKYNSGGAISNVEWEDGECVVDLMDGGPFVAYSSTRPNAVSSGGMSLPFNYENSTRMLEIEVPAGGKASVTIEF